VAGRGQRISEQTDVDVSGEVDGADPVCYIVGDIQGRRVATFRGEDKSPVETFVYHAAGIRGIGISGGVILRDRAQALFDDPDTYWNAESQETRDERIYYAADFRGDTAAMVTGAGKMYAQFRYSAYGVPFGIPLGDVDGDGDVDIDDDTHHKKVLDVGAYDVRGDLDLDGDVGTADQGILSGRIGDAAGRGVMSTASVANRFGWRGSVGMEWSPNLLRYLTNRGLFDSAIGVGTEDRAVTCCIACWAGDEVDLGSCARLLGDLSDILHQLFNSFLSYPLAYYPMYHMENPHQHCVWNCRMTIIMGEEWARDMSYKKEMLDAQIGRLMVNLMRCGLWRFVPQGLQDLLIGFGQSANQKSDWWDNFVGRQCGSIQRVRVWWGGGGIGSIATALRGCEDCCTNAGSGRRQGEGLGWRRPFGPGWPWDDHNRIPLNPTRMNPPLNPGPNIPPWNPNLTPEQIFPDPQQPSVPLPPLPTIPMPRFEWPDWMPKLPDWLRRPVSCVGGCS